MELCCFAVRAEWESGGSSGDCLLQTVCRCSLAALLKHTGLQNEACWQDRSVTYSNVIFTEIAVPVHFIWKPSKGLVYVEVYVFKLSFLKDGMM